MTLHLEVWEVSWTRTPCRWRHYSPSEHWELVAREHSIISQKSRIPKERAHKAPTLQIKNYKHSTLYIYLCNVNDFLFLPSLHLSVLRNFLTIFVYTFTQIMARSSSAWKRRQSQHLNWFGWIIFGHKTVFLSWKSRSLNLYE